MIPKKLHYCWFGPNPKSKIFQECLASWQQFCPDFEIIEWNERNSEKYANSFYRNALRKKKYAFAADYIRAKVLNEQGGIYLDTDMLLLKPIDVLLNNDFFIAEETDARVAFGLFGAVSGHRFLNQMVDFYNRAEFNVFSPPVITHAFSPIINRENLIEGEIILGVTSFYPLSYENRTKAYTPFIQPESYAVHLWDHSWGKPVNEDLVSLFSNLGEVIADFVFHNYSFAYFKRYAKEFSRKIYHKIRTKNG